MCTFWWMVHIGAFCEAWHEWSHNIIQGKSLVCIQFFSWVFLAKFIRFGIIKEMMTHFYILIPNLLLSYTNIHSMFCSIFSPKPWQPLKNTKLGGQANIRHDPPLSRTAISIKYQMNQCRLVCRQHSSTQDLSFTVDVDCGCGPFNG